MPLLACGMKDTAASSGKMPLGNDIPDLRMMWDEQQDTAASKYVLGNIGSTASRRCATVYDCRSGFRLWEVNGGRVLCLMLGLQRGARLLGWFWIVQVNTV